MSALFRMKAPSSRRLEKIVPWLKANEIYSFVLYPYIDSMFSYLFIWLLGSVVVRAS